MAELPADSQTLAEHAPRRHPWIRRFVVFLLAIVVIAIAGHWFWGYSAKSELDARVADIQKRGEPIFPADLNTPAVPDDKNAAIDLRAAATALDTRSDLWDRFSRMDVELPLTKKEIELLAKLLGQNQPALAKLRAARAKPDVDWGIKFQTPLVNIVVPDLSPQRHLAKLTQAAAIFAHHNKDDRAAIDYMRDLQFLGRAVDRMPLIVSHETASFIQAQLSAEAIRQIVPDFQVGSDSPMASPEQLRALVGELLDDKTMIDGQRRAHLAERAAQLDTINAILARKLGTNAMSGSGANTLSTSALLALRPMILRNALAMLDHATNGVAAAQTPDWPTLQKQIADEPAAQVAQNPRYYFLATALMPAYGATMKMQYRGLAERRMAATALAIRWYAAENDGKLPARIGDLVPKYLPAVPLDPFIAGGNPLNYKPEDPKPLLYSVGENSVDDGGSEELVSRRQSAAQWDRKDAVLHLTRQPRRSTRDIDAPVYIPSERRPRPMPSTRPN